MPLEKKSNTATQKRRKGILKTKERNKLQIL